MATGERLTEETFARYRAEGTDADLTVFDPARVRDRATYEEPMRYSEGIEQVLVSGVFVVRDGESVEDVFPGRPVLAGGG